MLHPSYSDLMQVVNSGVEEGEEPVVSSRYSIVLATAKRARQIIARQSGDNLDVPIVSKPLSQAISELNQGKIRILPEEEAAQLQEAAAGEAVQEQELAVQEEETQAQPE
ncbi:MAG: DNA-directed RNA polymerase subunit omega [Lachnospiraceae bacterium]|uniref:DNA-directed RNA polymerase subunit omega n=1 Tax=Parablautia sp. Marseille-Q6255 TaxID=3039593 RepID=UPI0024BD1FCA|nr:DNA-directed RNA polymerase subunit omega [Parablautia sp. Marseille-Q6255]